ncbi:hypothetical protein O0I10_008676 [Lichtheimia ornata]|uniref:CUE domain-containing protein n=1 Tax=Lichtheimia ornata TaxID=688661 RepID=A0AAD7UYW0_9FUNG|nr:uncharacterized protein O0I10_008676 [Lichtheimia ornata]KAJ8655588.1 hypothetical protein O0I10_008676 [Lichtheimia ornata]
MAVEDVLSQIQDLQATIENFTTCENTETMNNDHAETTATSTKRDSKTLICQPDEKTFVEDIEDAGKTLVESLTTSPAATAGTSLDQVSIRFSNDFSSLVDHFSALRERLDSEKLAKNDEKALVDSSSSSSNDGDSKSAHEERKPIVVDETKVDQQHQQDKLQVESDDNHTSSSSPNTTASQPAILVVSNDNTPPMRPSIESQRHHHHYYHQHMHSMPTSPLSACVATPRSRMSTTSRRSRRPSTLSKKSSKSSRYFAKHKKESSTVEYTARSYDEMMRIPDPRERLAFYEKTFKQCMRADSKLTSWMKRVKEKGLPKPMTEGYKPPPRPRTPDEAEQSKGTLHGNGSTASLSGSISMFLKKASASSTLGRRTFGETTPRPSMSRLFLPTSLSRLSLSKSSRQPKVAPEYESALPDYDFNRAKRPPPPMSTAAAQKPPRPAATMSATTTMGTNRWRTTTTTTTANNPPLRHKKTKKKRSTDSMSSTTTSTTTSPARSISSSFSKLSRLSRRQSTATLNSTTAKSKQQQQHGESSVDTVVTEMCNTLPHMDRRVIEEYLAEAGGDQMVAITLAMSQLKRPTTTTQPMYHHC